MIQKIIHKKPFKRIVSLILALSLTLGIITVSVGAYSVKDAVHDLQDYLQSEAESSEQAIKDSITDGNILGYPIIQMYTSFSLSTLYYLNNSPTEHYKSFFLVGVSESGHLYRLVYDSSQIAFSWFVNKAETQVTVSASHIDSNTVGAKSYGRAENKSVTLSPKGFFGSAVDFAGYGSLSAYDEYEMRALNLDGTVATTTEEITPYWVLIDDVPATQARTTFVSRSKELGIAQNDNTDTDGTTLNPSNSNLDFKYNYEGENNINAPSVRFINPSRGSNDLGLAYVDWIQQGLQYPIIDFSIDDNKHYHKYSVRISSNSMFNESVEYLYNNEEWRSQFKGLWWLGVESNPDNLAEKATLVAQILMIQELQNSAFDIERTLSSSDMNFIEGQSNVKAFSFCLSDYISVVKYYVYRIEVIDNTTGKIIDSIMFTNNRSYKKGDSGYGVQVHEYENNDDLYNDINSDNGYSNAENHTTSDKWTLDNDNDIFDHLGDLDYNISDIFDTLGSSVSDITSFFQACWGLLPPIIWIILLASLALIVLLRILGR